MALFLLHKLILQLRMRSHPVGLDVWFLVGLFIYFHTSRVPSLITYLISTKISWTASNIESTGSTPSRQQITKMLIRLHRCPGWSASLFTCGIDRSRQDLALTLVVWNGTAKHQINKDTIHPGIFLKLLLNFAIFSHLCLLKPLIALLLSQYKSPTSLQLIILT